MADDLEKPCVDYATTLRQEVLKSETFVRLTATGRQRNQSVAWEKVAVRPIEVGGKPCLQFSYFDGKKDITRNHAEGEAFGPLDEVLGTPFANFHVQAASGDLHVRISKRGKVFVTRGRPSREADAAALAHNRTKRYLLTPENGSAFLSAVGILDGNGQIRPTMQAKYRQINAFLGLISPRLESVLGSVEGRPIRIVDCGCGSAYLTFAVYAFLHDIRGAAVTVQGVDSNPELIEKCAGLAEGLGWSDLSFSVSEIETYAPEEKPDVVLSLHACDTATDDALAKGVAWGSGLIFAAPCCQRELLGQIRSDVMRPMLRHGILKARTADLVTDALRALLLRIAGYRADVVEFISPDQTSKNLMIRAEAGAAANEQVHLDEYGALAEFWNVTPSLEQAVRELGYLSPASGHGDDSGSG